jgi:glycosyltransferase involved in cell wall biosynthesis
VVPAGDAVGAADAVARVLADGERRRSVVEAARTSALRRFSLEITIARTLDAYRFLLGR